jgi:hypothetical protein
MDSLLIGFAICCLGWVALRAYAGALRPGPIVGFIVDALPVLIGFLLFVLATARPILSSAAIVGLAVGLAVVDRVKRIVLAEPVVFADRSELLELVRHPQLYLPFAGTLRVLIATSAVLALVAFVFWIEPPLWRAGAMAHIGMALLAPAIGVACFVVPTWQPFLRRLRRTYHRLGLSRDPETDIARVGLLGSCVMHATLARAERRGRRQVARGFAMPELPQGGIRTDGGPIVIVQAESFMDAERLHPSLTGCLPAISRLRRESVIHGKLAVPCWGANTIRTEVAVLTGLPVRVFGLDRFNPYAAFLDPTLPSLARAARDAGYVTVCVHPFDMRFYERHRALQMLGFDHLVGQEAFGAARRDGQYVADVEVANKVSELLACYGRRTLILAITMENHGPWEGMSSLAPSRPLPAPIANVPDAEPFGRWLRHAQGTDSMIPILTKSLHDIATATGEPGWLMVYGDHQPSLPKALRALGVDSEQTDYVIWRTHPQGAGRMVDLSADELPAELIGAMDVDVRTAQRVTLA